MRFIPLISLCACAVNFATLAFAGEIRGRVLDAAGAPVAGARVLAAENQVAQINYSTPKGAFALSASAEDKILGAQGKLTGEATTDAEGRFMVPDLRAARFTLFSFEVSRGFALRTDVESGAEVDLDLKPGATVTGKFVGFTFDPKKHVLQLKPRAPFHNILLVPNVEYVGADGFRCGPVPDVPGWNLVLTEWVIERGFSATIFSEPIDLAPEASREVRMDLTDGEALAGFVRSVDEAPLAHVAVVARSTSTPVRERGAVTDQNGRYSLPGLSAGEWTLDARRWTLRPTAGCGVGPKDVFGARTILIPATEPGQGDLRIERLLGSPQVGDVAPDFEVQTLAGRSIALHDLRGKVVLVDFWATWCGMCRAEFPRLREVYAGFGGGEKFEIVGVSIDEDREAARRVTDRLQLTWPQTALGPVETNPLAQLYNIASTPSSFLIDRHGKVVAVNKSAKELQAELTRLLPPK